MKYYRNKETGSIYKAEPTKFSDGTPTITLSRFNWNMRNWYGHVHDYPKTFKQIEEGVVIVEITKEEADAFLKN